MLIGVPKEIKAQENRVGLNPASVAECVHHGHKVLVEAGAGQGIGARDDDYRTAGAEIAADTADVFARAEMIVKVKEPQEAEWKRLRAGQVLFTYLHLAPDPKQARGLMESGCTAIAYETVTGARGGLPLLAPMSEIAGRMAPVMGAFFLQKHKSGLGRLISGVPGVEPAKVLVLGGGVAGFNAARVAVGMGARVSIFEKNPDRIRFLDEYFGTSANVVAASTAKIQHYAPIMDIVIGAVLVPGGAAPKLITNEMLKAMKAGAVLVDIAIDQGGCFESSRITTHDDPVYTVEGVSHYCVANMPGAYPQSSTQALNNATLPYVLALADKGWERACAEDPGLKGGVNVHAGKIVHPAVAEALGFA
ncbi:MAG: alanine dehydrogenase [Rhodospirillales bacterium]|nr:alanine dehydrogenase [Alphaproteobacteria bacterium]MCB9987325.1 alanine dehydrogenase [Rhodospirillales bacterium]USO07820.1 MAG: alanine dehydrogenase [Rhodospirillales bacterium]